MAIKLLKKSLPILILHCIINISNAQWNQIGADINGEAANDESGFVVSLTADGTRVAIGARLNNNVNGSLAGHVRVYEYDGVNWVQLGAEINGETGGDQSGYSLSLSPNGLRLAIGAPFNDGSGTDAGHTRIFEFTGGSWIQIGADINGEAAHDRSGTSVSMSLDGSRVAIGAYLNDGSGTDAGHVRVYEYNAGSWLQIGIDINGEAAGDYSGSAVALSSNGNRLAVGGYQNDGNGVNSGHVRVFEYSAGNWVHIGNDINGEAAGDISGYAVSISPNGNVVASGAIYNGGNGATSGHVRVFEYSASNWVQIGNDINGEFSGDQSGYSISLSTDGNYIAIGTVNNDGNGIESGSTRVYRNYSGNWVQLETDIDGEVNGDWSGNSVSLSADGSKLAVGARFNDGNGSNSGHTRIFGCSNILNVTDMVYHCTLEEAILSASMNDVLEIPAGIYSSQCYTIDKTLTIIPSGGLLTIECLIMNGLGKNLLLGGNLTINQLTLTHGNINTNGYHLKCGTISGGTVNSYIVTD